MEKGTQFNLQALPTNRMESASFIVKFRRQHWTLYVQDRPVVVKGQIVIRPIMTYSFTYDHRLVGGALAAQFMTALTNELNKAAP